jgi:hypothetical protein
MSFKVGKTTDVLSKVERKAKNPSLILNQKGIHSNMFLLQMKMKLL